MLTASGTPKMPTGSCGTAATHSSEDCPASVHNGKRTGSLILLGPLFEVCPPSFQSVGVFSRVCPNSAGRGRGSPRRCFRHRGDGDRPALARCKAGKSKRVVYIVSKCSFRHFGEGSSGARARATPSESLGQCRARIAVHHRAGSAVRSSEARCKGESDVRELVKWTRPQRLSDASETRKRELQTRSDQAE